MGTREEIEKCFKRLVCTSSFEDITIAALCKTAGISRKTFYLHFHDKQDVVEHIFIKDVIDPVDSLSDLLPFVDKEKASELLYERLYLSVMNNKEYYSKLVGTFDDLDSPFGKVVSQTVYQMDYQRIKAGNYGLSDLEADYAAHFFSSSQAALLLKWVKDDTPLSPAEISSLHRRLANSFWENPSLPTS